MNPKMNPILTNADLACLAGLFDGEGTAGVYLHKQRNNRNIPIRSPQVAVAMTDPDPIRFLALCLGGNVYTCGRRTRGNRPVYKWVRAHRKALHAAQALLPWVKNESKVEQLCRITQHYGM